MNIDRDISIDLATLADASEIALMSRDYIEAGLGWSWTPSRVGKSITDPETVVSLAKAGHTIAGFAIMRFGQARAHLNLLAVRPAYRDQGLGSYLIRWLEETARTAGTFAVSLELVATNTPARRFYEGLGYQRVTRIPAYYRNNTAALRMARDLRIDA
jgi:ribosomal-protein-alanine N-acetyltransferase